MWLCDSRFVCLGMFVLSLLAMMPFSHRAFTIACNNYYNNLSERSILSSLVGGTLMGLGMTISGSVCETLRTAFQSETCDVKFFHKLLLAFHGLNIPMWLNSEMKLEKKTASGSQHKYVFRQKLFLFPRIHKTIIGKEEVIPVLCILQSA